MTTSRRPNPLRIAVVLALILGAALCFQRFGRPLWHPLLAWATGGISVDTRLAQIAASHPDLPGTTFHDLVLVACKQERRLEVWSDRRLWRSFPILAASGHPGPKLRTGDHQVPEGLYRIAAVNPESNYHLSLRVSYPNAEDRARSTALGITDLGGDIYIHGKADSLGCIAIGDDGIEQVFYAVCRAGYDSVAVVVAPHDLPLAAPTEAPELAELYARIGVELARVRGTR